MISFVNATGVNVGPLSSSVAAAALTLYSPSTTNQTTGQAAAAIVNK